MKAVRWLRYKGAGRFRRQTCGDCFHDSTSAVWFYVPDDVWTRVMDDDQRVLCLPCFDRRAERRGVDYGAVIEVQGRGSWLAGRDRLNASESRASITRSA